MTTTNTTSTFTDLVKTADTLHRDTAWIVKYLARRAPADAKVWTAPASTIAEPIADFRKSSTAGLIRVSDLTIGAACGQGYLNGEKGPWSEMRDKIVAAFLGGEAPATPVRVRKAKTDAPVQDTKTETAPAAETPMKEVARPAKISGDYLVCECCGRRVSYEEGLVRLGGKRICGKCAKAKTAHVNVPNPDADL